VACQPDTETIDTRVVKALGHPTRVQILAVLRDRELASPVELAAELGLALGTVGYHVRRLETLGFIELAKRTQRRGAVEHHYRACTTLPSVAAAAPDLPRVRGRAAEAVDATTDAQQALARGGFDAVIARADLRHVVLDARGRAALRRALDAWIAKLEQIERASADRLAARGSSSPAHRCGVVLMAFESPGDDDVT
jgi:DNA-binding transcriptional ArsR family regulator